MWKAITAAISSLPVVKAVSDINKTVVEGTPEELLVALKSPVASIRSITDECAVTYQEKLREARDNKAEKCEYGPTSSTVPFARKVYLNQHNLCIQMYG